MVKSRPAEKDLGEKGKKAKRRKGEYLYALSYFFPLSP
jgi:hypothetical protein